MTKVKQPTDIVRLRQIDSAATDEEVTKRIFDILGWEIFEYKDAIVEWDENEEEIIVEIPFYGVKMADGTRYYKGTPFVEEIYEYVKKYLITDTEDTLRKVIEDVIGGFVRQ